jgi:hypothetical protein
MSDQLFAGAGPISDAGKEYVIFNLDDHARSLPNCSGRQMADLGYGD